MAWGDVISTRVAVGGGQNGIWAARAGRVWRCAKPGRAVSRFPPIRVRVGGRSQSSQEEEDSVSDPRGWEAPLTRQHSGWWPLIRNSIFPRVSAGCMSAPFAESSSTPLNRLAGFRLLGPSTPSAAFRCAQVLSPRPSLTTCRICWCSSFGGVPWTGPPSSDVRLYICMRR